MSQSAKTRLSNAPKAAELIDSNGFQATSIDAIIATTQGTKGFFYHLKKKKEIGLASLINEVICPGIRADRFFYHKNQNNNRFNRSIVAKLAY